MKNKIDWSVRRLDLDGLIRSDTFAHWDNDNRSPGSFRMIHEDPDRFDRIQDAAENGSEGSTHREIISDWFYFLQDSQCCRLPKKVYDRINQQINACQEWHSQNGSLDHEVG